MLEVENLTVSYRGVLALESVSFQVQPGQLVGIIGPNGAGKSSLIKGMLGLTPISEGTVKFDSQPLQRQLRKVAYVPQRSQIDWNYPITVWNVVLLARSRATSFLMGYSRQSKELAKNALQRVNLWDLRHRPIGELSGGQQQRVFLARSLAQQAELFLFDEPFNGVDQTTKDIIFDIFSELKAENKTLIVVSHNIQETLKHYDRLLLINKKLLASGHPKIILKSSNIQKAYGCDLSLSIA